MIDIFSLKEETEFFHKLALDKMAEDRFREVVHITFLFPDLLFKLEAPNNQGIRRWLMACLID